MWKVGEMSPASRGVFYPGYPRGGGGGGRSPGQHTPPPSGAWAAFVAQRIPEIFMLAHPEWIPAVPWALANWVRGSFKLTGNCKTKNRQFHKTNVLIALLKCLGFGRVCVFAVLELRYIRFSSWSAKVELPVACTLVCFSRQLCP